MAHNEESRPGTPSFASSVASSLVASVLFAILLFAVAKLSKPAERTAVVTVEFVVGIFESSDGAAVRFAHSEFGDYLETEIINANALGEDVVLVRLCSDSPESAVFSVTKNHTAQQAFDEKGAPPIAPGKGCVIAYFVGPVTAIAVASNRSGRVATGTLEVTQQVASSNK